jgi:hypothetical protein
MEENRAMESLPVKNTGKTIERKSSGKQKTYRLLCRRYF